MTVDPHKNNVIVGCNSEQPNVIDGKQVKEAEIKSNSRFEAVMKHSLYEKAKKVTNSIGAFFAVTGYVLASLVTLGLFFLIDYEIAQEKYILNTFILNMKPFGIDSDEELPINSVKATKRFIDDAYYAIVNATIAFKKNDSINALAFTADACQALTSASDAIANILPRNKGYVSVYKALIVAHDTYASANTISTIEAAYPTLYAVQQAFENVGTVDDDQKNNEIVIDGAVSAASAPPVDKAVTAAFANLLKSYKNLTKAKKKMDENKNFFTKRGQEIAHGAFIIARQNAYDVAKKNPSCCHERDALGLLATALVDYKDAKKSGVKPLTELKSKLEQTLCNAAALAIREGLRSKLPKFGAELTLSLESKSRSALGKHPVLGPTLSHEDDGVENTTTKRLLDGYFKNEGGWVLVLPKDLLKLDEPFPIGAGAIGFEGNGNWKIHVSINPKQMEKAIPIILKILHAEGAPRVGFKMQTKLNLDSDHQIGKEFAIIFDKSFEKDPPKEVQKLLNLLSKALIENGIRPEAGYVLTSETMEEIKKAPEEDQTFEKKNLERCKFDRAIPSKHGPQFFYYRDEEALVIADDQIKGMRVFAGKEGSGNMISVTQFQNLLKRQPAFAHNPIRKFDPFLSIKIDNR